MTDQLDDPVEQEQEKSEINETAGKEKQSAKIANRYKIHLPLPSPDKIINSREDKIKYKDNECPSSSTANNPAHDLIKVVKKPVIEKINNAHDNSSA